MSDTEKNTEIDDVEIIDNAEDDLELDIEDEIVAEEGVRDKNKKLRDDIRSAKDQAQEYLVGWQKERASFANYKAEEERKRKERLDMMKLNLISDFFPVLDSFDMAFANQEAWEKVDPAWRSGVEYIHSQFRTVLDNYNLTVIDQVDIDFDPHVHDPVEHIIVDNESMDNKIIRVIQKGYRSGDIVLRAARVNVGKYEG